ncbi:MAG: hypothetical protein P8N49_07305 [Opitutales bacterium]|nr:hypothetical protein [Opitutales bacterium]
MKPVLIFFLFSLMFSVLLKAIAPVTYSGKIFIRGVNYFGEAQYRKEKIG